MKALTIVPNFDELEGGNALLVAALPGSEYA